MALHKNFPKDKFQILNPEIRWFPAEEDLRKEGYEKLLPPFVPELREQVAKWRENNYEGASETSKALLNWWLILVNNYEGKISIKELSGGANIISETRVGEKIDDKLLNVKEKNLIKKIAGKWSNKNTKEIVDFTHSQIPYTFVDKGDIIPYELITQEESRYVY